MKKICALCALACLGLSVFLGIELSRTRALLKAEQDREMALQPMRSGLLAASEDLAKAAQAAESKAAGLAAKLQAQRRELDEAKKHLALLTARLENAGTPQRLAKGTYTLEDGTVVYGPDAKLRLPNGMVVTSPTGIMVSDAAVRHIDGDLVVTSANGQYVANNAYLSVEDGHISVKADTVESK
jgi:hypothetical protein